MAGIIREARRWAGFTCLALLLSGLVLPSAWGVIETLTTLDKFVADADLILVANIKQLDLDNNRLVLAVDSRSKGEDPAATLPVRLGGNASEALAGVSQGDSVVLFISRGKEQSLAYGYANGAWFHLTGTTDQDKVRWQFKAGEPYLRRTYADETRKLVEILTAHLAGTSGLPAPDTTIAPGYGLVAGKHPALAKASDSNIAQTPSPVRSEQPSSSRRNVLLMIAAAGCAFTLVFMLTRSVPQEDADA